MDYSKYKTLKVDLLDGVATLTLNAPDVLNAVTNGGKGIHHRELEDVWLDLAEDERVRVIVLTGAGRAFSAGGDLQALADRHGTPENWRGAVRATRSAPRMLLNILSVPQPIIAAINGDAMGIGATLALMADTTVISESARIGDTHVRVGLVAGDGGTVIWPLLLGAARAKDFLMRARVVDGREADRIGLVAHVAPADQVMARAMDVAREYLRLPPLAVRWTKLAANQAIKEAFVRNMDAAIALEALSFMSEDHGEAVHAFIERRAPRFVVN